MHRVVCYRVCVCTHGIVVVAEASKFVNQASIVHAARHAATINSCHGKQVHTRPTLTFVVKVRHQPVFSLSARTELYIISCH